MNIYLFITGLQNLPTGEFDIDGIKFKITKDGDSCTIHASYQEDFRTDFKKNLDSLDDDLFVQYSELLADHYDLKEFDTLLTKENPTEEDLDNARDMINLSNSIISDVIQSKIEELQDLKKVF